MVVNTTRQGPGRNYVPNKGARLVVAVCAAFVALGGPRARGDAPEQTAARDLGALAMRALDRHEPELAARRFEEAYELDPYPLWQLGAARAWLEAAETTRAVERFERALDDPRLATPARSDAARLLVIARDLTPKVTAAVRASQANDHDRARRAWEEAFDRWPLGRFLVLAARAAERAGGTRDLRRLAAEASRRADLGADERRWIDDVQARWGVDVNAAPASTTPTAREPIGPWILVGAGALVVLGGGVSLLVADEAYQDVRAMRAGAVEGVVLETTRAKATARADEARQWNTAGWLAIGVGAVVTAFGAGWRAAAPTSEGAVMAPPVTAVSWSVAPTAEGWLLSARGGF